MSELLLKRQGADFIGPSLAENTKLVDPQW